jgi:DNA polymerase-3 subunit delta
MIAYQFRNLLLVKELAERRLMYNSIVKKSGLHPFVVKKSYFNCSKFSFDELKNIYKKIFQIDLDIKTGKIEPETALDLFVTSI